MIKRGNAGPIFYLRDTIAVRRNSVLFTSYSRKGCPKIEKLWMKLKQNFFLLLFLKFFSSNSLFCFSFYKEMIVIENWREIGKLVICYKRKVSIIFSFIIISSSLLSRIFGKKIFNRRQDSWYVWHSAVKTNSFTDVGKVFCQYENSE